MILRVFSRWMCVIRRLGQSITNVLPDFANLFMTGQRVCQNRSGQVRFTQVGGRNAFRCSGSHLFLYACHPMHGTL